MRRGDLPSYVVFLISCEHECKINLHDDEVETTLVNHLSTFYKLHEQNLSPRNILCEHLKLHKKKFEFYIKL